MVSTTDRGAYWSASDGVAQGVSGSVGGASAGNVLNFDHWQYVDELYYYAHNMFSVPPTQWVNAGHRNGVPVLGAVTGDCTYQEKPYCGPEATTLFDAANYLQAEKKLYAYAVAYGFDGWVIDFENGFWPNANVLRAVKDLAGMTLPNGQRLRVEIYEQYSYNLLCAPGTQPPCQSLLPYFRAGASWQSDYNMGTGYPAQTYKNLADAGLAAQRLRAYWATDVYRIAPFKTCTATTTTLVWNGNGNECLDTTALFDNQRTVVGPGPPNGPKYYTSVALYAPEWTYFGNLLDHPAGGGPPGGPKSRALVHAADDALWVGANVKYSGQNCTRTGTSNAESALIAPRSVVGTLPFVTSFNEGEGGVYALGGYVVAAAPWNDLSAARRPSHLDLYTQRRPQRSARLREQQQPPSIQRRVGAGSHRAGRWRGGALPNTDSRSRRVETHCGLRGKNELRAHSLRQGLLRRRRHGDGQGLSGFWLERDRRLRPGGPGQDHRTDLGGIRWHRNRPHRAG